MRLQELRHCLGGPIVRVVIDVDEADQARRVRLCQDRPQVDGQALDVVVRGYNEHEGVTPAVYQKQELIDGYEHFQVRVLVEVAALASTVSTQASIAAEAVLAVPTNAARSTLLGAEFTSEATRGCSACLEEYECKSRWP